MFSVARYLQYCVYITAAEYDHWSPFSIYGELRRLRQEEADLLSERELLERLPYKGDLNTVEALQILAKTQNDIAKLQTELSALRRERPQRLERYLAASSFRDRDAAARTHGRTLFLTMCAGNYYFDSFCAPFFASFERAYGIAAVNHRVVAFTADVDTHFLKIARARFGPWGVFEVLAEEGDIAKVYGGSNQVEGDMYCETDSEGGPHKCKVSSSNTNIRKKKVHLNNMFFQFAAASYLKDHGSDYCFAVIIDSDTLFVRPLTRFLPRCSLDIVPTIAYHSPGGVSGPGLSNALEFPGANLPQPPFTLTVRFRAESVGTKQDILCWTSADRQRGVELRLTAFGVVQYGEHDGKMWRMVSSTHALALANAPQHDVAVVRSHSGEVFIYINGTLSGEGFFPVLVPVGLLGTAKSARLVHGHDDSVFNGKIESLQIYESALGLTDLLSTACISCNREENHTVFVERKRSSGWDVAFTAYDRHLIPPWANSPAQVGKTRNGFTRVNAGVVLLSLSNVDLACRFLSQWAHAAAWLAFSGDLVNISVNEGLQSLSDLLSSNVFKLKWERWHGDLVEEFKSPNQAALAFLASSYDLHRLSSLLSWESGCAICTHAVEASLQTYPEDEPLLVRMRALPCSALNHPESMLNGKFPNDLLVVHLKGLWWRNVLPSGMHFLIDKHRRSDWNRDSLLLHRQLYTTWQFALPASLQNNGSNWKILSADGADASRDSAWLANQFKPPPKGDH